MYGEKKTNDREKNESIACVIINNLGYQIIVMAYNFDERPAKLSRPKLIYLFCTYLHLHQKTKNSCFRRRIHSTAFFKYRLTEVKMPMCNNTHWQIWNQLQATNWMPKSKPMYRLYRCSSGWCAFDVAINQIDSNALLSFFFNS